MVNDCLHFVDKKGRVISKSSTKVNRHLEMKYEADDLAFHFNAYCHFMGNGSCYLQVKKDEAVVFEANGSFTIAAWGMKAETYQPGDWERIIPPRRQ